MNPSNVFPNGAFHDTEAESKEFPVDAFGTPQTILYGHTLNQGDGFGSQFGTSAVVA